jgi:hypothetical protein
MTFRKPSIRISPKGKLSFSPGSLRVGKRLGFTASRSGMTGSARLRRGVSVNTRRGLNCLPMVCLALVLPVAVWLVV